MPYHFTPRALPESDYPTADLVAYRDQMLVSRRLRELIESFEPGVHRFDAFVPPDDARLSHAPRYVLHVGQELDAVSPEHSTWVKQSGVLWRPSGSIDERLVFDARAIGSRHLWHNVGFGSERRYWASDRLMEAALGQGMTGPLVSRYDQTDAAGAYQPPARSMDRVYVLYASRPMRPNDPHVPLTIKAEPLDGDLKRVQVADPRHADVARSQPVLERGVPVDPTYVPTRAYYYQNAKGLPTELFAHGAVPLSVTGRFHEIVERFEPDTHQFLPIDFVDKQGAPIERRHVFVVCNQIDSVSRAHSQMRFDRLWHNPHGELGVLVYDRASIGGRHVWRDSRVMGNPIHYSAELAEAIQAAGFPTVRYASHEMR